MKKGTWQQQKGKQKEPHLLLVVMHHDLVDNAWNFELCMYMCTCVYMCIYVYTYPLSFSFLFFYLLSLIEGSLLAVLVQLFKVVYGWCSIIKILTSKRRAVRLHHSPIHLRLHVNLDDATSANNDCESVHATIASEKERNAHT